MTPSTNCKEKRFLIIRWGTLPECCNTKIETMPFKFLLQLAGFTTENSPGKKEWRNQCKQANHLNICKKMKFMKRKANAIWKYCFLRISQYFYLVLITQCGKSDISCAEKTFFCQISIHSCKLTLSWKHQVIAPAEFWSLGVIEAVADTDWGTEIYLTVCRTCSSFIRLQKIVLERSLP